MSAILVRNLSSAVHDALREIARARGLSVETLAREVLTKAANDERPRGIDFERLARHKKTLGIAGGGPEWTAAMDDPGLSRRVLGLEE